MRILLVILFVLFTFQLINAKDIDDLLIIESKLYPKIVMLDENIINSQIKIGLVYNTASKEIAKKFKKYLKLNNIDSVLIDMNSLNKQKVDSYIITFSKINQKLLNKLLNKHKLIFGIYPKNIKNTMIDIYIGVKVKLILNMKLIKAGGINLNPIIFKVAEIYNEK